MKKEEKLGAFTLFELVIVITIITILSAIGYLGYSGSKAKATYSKVVVDMDTVASAASMYKLEKKVWPLDGYPGHSPTILEGDPNGGEDIVFTKFMPVFPDAPCGDYDWENWSIPGSSFDDANKVIRVSYRTNDPAIYYFHCIESRDGTCLGQNAAPAFISSNKGDDIRSIDKITCNE